MALTKQFIDVPTNTGIDTKTDPVNDTPPAYSDILNMRVPYTSQYTPRTGFSSYGSVSIGTAGPIVGLRDAIFSENDEVLYKHSNNASAVLGRSWSPYCERITLGLTTSQFSEGASQVTSVVLSDGRTLCVWANTTPNAGFSWQILSATGEYQFGGRQTVSPATSNLTQVDCAAGPNGTGIVTAVSSASSTITCYSISNGTATQLTVPSRSNVTQIRTLYTGSLLYMMYKTSTPTTVLQTWSLSGTTLTSTNTVTLSTGVTTGRHIDLVATTNYVAAAYWDSTTALKTAFVNSSLTLIADRSIATDSFSYTQMNGFGLAAYGTNYVALVYTGAAYTRGSYLTVHTFTTTGTITTVHNLVEVAFVAVTSPVIVDSKVMIGTIDLAVQGYATNALVQVADLGSPYGSTAVIELITHWSSGTASTGRVSALMSRSSAIPFNTLGRIAKGASGLFIPSLYINRVTDTGESLLFTTAAVTSITVPVVQGENTACVLYASLTETAAASAISHGASAAIVGPRVTSVDGLGIGPSSVWPMFIPQDMDLTNATGLDTNSTYFVVFVKRWTDGFGNSQTLETPPIQIVTAGGTLLRPSFCLTAGIFKIPMSKPSTTAEAVIDVYLTEPNGTIPYYYDTFTSSDSPFTGAAPYYYTINTDTVDLTSPLPSASGEIPNTSLSAVRQATDWRGRVAALVADNPRLIAYSKPVYQGTFTSFAPGLEIEVSQASSKLTALASMDGVLYAFTNNQVYTIYGDPAGATGENSTLTLPEIRFNGVGCQDPKSVILTPKGLFFKSAKGIYVILRNQELAFVGDGPYSSREDTVVGAWASTSTSEVGFMLDTGDAWVYDWQQTAWMRWTVPRMNMPNDTVSGACYLNGSIYYNTDTYVYKEDSASTEVIPTSVTTAWIRLGALQGYQRVYSTWLFLETLDTFTMTIDLYIDGDDQTSKHTWTIDSTDLDILNPQQIKLSMPIQKCESYKLVIASTTAGWALKGIMAEIGVKDTANKSRRTPQNY